jgi:trans-feruloyl-CoA hydratase/vanillin synthase
MAKSSESQFLDPERGRTQGLSQFLDEKSFRPGLSGYKRRG